jgi:hypothetical protein
MGANAIAAHLSSSTPSEASILIRDSDVTGLLESVSVAEPGRGPSELLEDAEAAIARGGHSTLTFIVFPGRLPSIRCDSRLDWLLVRLRASTMQGSGQDGSSQIHSLSEACVGTGFANGSNISLDSLKFHNGAFSSDSGSGRTRRIGDYFLRLHNDR